MLTQDNNNMLFKNPKIEKNINKMDKLYTILFFYNFLDINILIVNLIIFYYIFNS